MSAVRSWVLFSVLVLGFFGGTARAGQVLAGDWPTMGRDAGHTSYFPGQLGGRQFTHSWTATVGGDMLQAAVGNGLVYATRQGYFDPCIIKAYNLTTGVLTWQKDLDEPHSCSPPTYDNGRVFVERCNHSDDTQLWCLNAANGNTVWSAPQTSQWEYYYAPLVSGGGVWCNGGSYGGLYGRSANTGAEWFFVELEQYDCWSPAAWNGSVYTWVEGIFRCHNPTTGAVIWSLDLGWDWHGWSIETVPVIANGMAYVLRSADSFGDDKYELVAINLATHVVQWQTTGRFSGNPAVANGIVYVICQGTVVAYNAATGAKVGCYSSDGEKPLLWQPIVTDDALMAATEDETFIFRLGNYDPHQVLPHGGYLSLAQGRIVVCTPAGQLQCYALKADSPPVARHDSITVAAGGQLTFDPRVNDVDPEGQALSLLSLTPGKGQAVINPDNTITYTAPQGLDGAYDRIVYAVQDPGANSAIATVFVQIGTPEGDWWTMGGNVRHSSYVPETRGPYNYTQAWTRSVHPLDYQQVSVANGRILAVAEGYMVQPKMSALDLKTGQLLWERTFEEAYGMGPPSYDSDRVVAARSNHDDDTYAWCLNPSTGASYWSSPMAAQWPDFYAPCMTGGEIWTAGGYYGGMYGFELATGIKRFSVDLPDADGWSPAYYNGRVYSWVEGVFSCHHPTTGDVEWSSDYGGFYEATVPAVKDGYAYVIKGDIPDQLICINLATHVAQFTVSGTFQGSPAVADRVYVMSGPDVKAYNLLTGALEHTYSTGSIGNMIWQPIIFDDQLIVASDTQTFVFSLGATTPRQTLSVGGALSFAANRLLVTSSNGSLTCFVGAFDELYVNSNWPVGEDADGDEFFHTILGAQGVARSGARIHVAEGDYPEDVTLNKSLTLYGDVESGSVQSLTVDGATFAITVQPGSETQIGRLHIWSNAAFSGANAQLRCRVAGFTTPGVHYDQIYSSSGEFTPGGQLHLDIAGLSNQCGTFYPVEFDSLATGAFAGTTLENNAGQYCAYLTYDTGAGDVRVDLLCPPLTMDVTPIGSVRPVFSWDAVSGCDAYELKIVRQGDGQVFLDPTEVTSPCACPVDLVVGETYVWSVRTRMGALYSEWRQAVYIMKDPTDLAVIGCDVTVRPDFTWTNNSGGAHDILIRRKSDSAVIIDKTGAPNPYTCEVDLDENIQYEWFVRTHDGPAIGEWVPGPDFMVNVVPETIDDLTSELVWTGTLGDLPVAVATSSGEWSATYAAAKGVDGNTGSDWRTPGRAAVQEEWFRADLGSSKLVDQVRILPSGAYPRMLPDAFVVEVSTNGTDFTEVANVTGYTAASGVWWVATFAARSARYVQLRADSSTFYGANVVSFAEMKVRGILSKVTPTGTSSSGEWSATYAAAKGVDGNSASDWRTPNRAAVQEEWFRADLGAVKKVEKVRILPSGAYPRMLPDAFVVEVSANGTDYTEVANVTGYTAASGVWWQATFGAQTARYVRFRANSSTFYGANLVAFAEMEIHEKPGQAVRLEWTAPGDDGASGTAASYEVKYSTVGAVTDGTWDGAASVATGVPTPQSAGTTQSMMVDVSNLRGEIPVWYGIRTTDEVGNESLTSNSPQVTTPNIAPAAVTNLAAHTPAVDGFSVAFTAPGDDGDQYTATTYDVRCSTGPLTEATWGAAIQMGVEPAPQVAETAESFALTGAVQPDTTYNVGIKVADEIPNWSPLSNVVTIKTADVTPPAVIANLDAQLTQMGTLGRLPPTGATSSGDYNGTYVTANGIDGNASTAWVSPGRPAVQEEWYRVDLGAVKQVEKVRILPVAAYPRTLPDNFVVEVSTNGTDYTEVANVTGYVAAAGVWWEASFAPQSTRYVQLRANSSTFYGARVVGLAELQACAIQPVLVAAGATSTGDYNGTYVTANGIDCDTGTAWVSPKRPAVQEEWYRADLGAVKQVEKVRILPVTAYPRTLPDAFVVEVSTNGTDYTEVANVTGYTAAAGVWWEGTFTAQDARYVRLRANSSTFYGARVVGFAEMEVHEKAGQGVLLTWTAPGDNGTSGTAASYDIRRYTSAVTDGTWGSATPLTGVPLPQVAGTAQSMTVSMEDLGSPTSGTVIHFGMRTSDEVPNQSLTSNSDNVTAP